jgi:hypothetical protein
VGQTIIGSKNELLPRKLLVGYISEDSILAAASNSLSSALIVAAAAATAAFTVAVEVETVAVAVAVAGVFILLLRVGGQLKLLSEYNDVVLPVSGWSDKYGRALVDDKMLLRGVVHALRKSVSIVVGISGVTGAVGTGVYIMGVNCIGVTATGDGCATNGAACC